jgi:LysR family nitrogen assimilation transcriptional regulator
LDIKQLRTFLAIAGSGSVTRASEILHIVQPALSRQLRLLEEDLGTSLFERRGRGMQLTDAGLMLVDRARRALHELDQAKAEIIAAPETVTGTVTIGLLPSVSNLLAAPLVDKLKRQYPKLAVCISIGFAGYLQQWLENGEIDVALLYFTTPSATLEVVPLLDEVLYLVGPFSAGLRPDRPVRLRDMEAMSFVMPTHPHGLRLLLDHACAMAGMNLLIAAETNAMGVQKDLVEHGLGYTVLPGVAVFEDVKCGRLSAAPITAPDLSRRLVLASSVTRRSSLAVRRTIAELQSQIKGLIESDVWPGATWIESA